jgi:outer membrane protein OmpA-like peptidoglycan-associated protein
MVRKIIGTVLCFTVMVAPAGAQGFTVELNGGLQGTHYSLPNGKSQPQAGSSLALGYGFRLGDRVNLLTGIGGGVYRTRASLHDGILSTSYQVDDGGSAFQYSVKATGYKETQSLFAASIPLLLQYHTDGAGMQWYVDGGGKVFFPFNPSVDVSADKLTLSGYYPDYNVEVSDLPQHGFGTINDWKGSTTAKLRPAAALSVATGVSFGLTHTVRLYAGVYVDYGLTGLKAKGDSMPLVTYSSTGVNGVQAGSVLNRPATGSVALLSFGVQVKLGFGSVRPHPATRPKERKSLANDSISDAEYELIQRPVIFGLLGETAVPEFQKEHLDEVAAFLKQHPAVRLSLTGHTCDNDTETEDKRLGAERAKAVAEYLESKGVDRRRLDVGSAGRSDEFTPFDPLANYQKRRVVIAVK